MTEKVPGDVDSVMQGETVPTVSSIVDTKESKDEKDEKSFKFKINFDSKAENIEISNFSGIDKSYDDRFMMLNGIMIPCTQGQPKFELKYESEHEKPVPPGLGDVSDNHEIQERLFNMLPLTELQKKDLRNQLVKEELTTTRSKCNKRKLDKAMDDLLLSRKEALKERDNKQRDKVKTH